MPQGAGAGLSLGWGDSAAPVHSHVSHLDRVRRIPLVLYDSDAATPIAEPAIDAHGTLSTDGHYHLENAATSTLKTILGVILPSDYTTRVLPVIKYRYSSSTAAGNNVRWVVVVREISTGATHTSLLSSTATVAEPAAADSLVERELTFTTQPTPGTHLSVSIQRVGADAADSSTGTVSVWAAWIEYTADS